MGARTRSRSRTARARRRRLGAPRRAKRWLRRQDAFTRGLLVAVAVLFSLIVALIVPRLRGERPGQRVARNAPPVQSAPAVPARRAHQARVPAHPASTAAPKAAPATPRQAVDAARHVSAPRAAIVIDDLGQSLSHLEQLAGLKIPLSIAVIPGLPATSRTVEEASRLGIEILLHQPMEPREETGKNPGEGVLLNSMSAGQLRARLRESLAAVPGAVGVNNHMGSRFTENAAGLEVLMAELGRHDLFWLDSRTTAASQGAATARAAGVPTIERDIFLDAEVTTDFIRGQVRKLIETARLRGSAVSIGHPHAETISVLREMREELLGSGVALVPVSALVHPSPATGTVPALAASVSAARRKHAGAEGAMP